MILECLFQRRNRRFGLVIHLIQDNRRSKSSPLVLALDFSLQHFDRSGGIAESSSVDLSKLTALDGVREHPSRVKCATLPWHALHAALSQSQTTATTE